MVSLFYFHCQFWNLVSECGKNGSANYHLTTAAVGILPADKLFFPAEQQYKSGWFHATYATVTAMQPFVIAYQSVNPARCAGSDRSMSASGSAGPGFNPRRGSKF